MSSNISLRSILDANKFIGPNFLDWHRNVRIVLKQEKKSCIFFKIQFQMPLLRMLKKKLEMNINVMLMMMNRLHV
jgi:hypothetical protein